MFWTDSADTPSITIDAIASGQTSWELADKTMLFNPGSGYSNTDSTYSSETIYQMFNTASGFPGSVGKYEVSWTWRVLAVNGTPPEPEDVGATSHTLYTLWDSPDSFYYQTAGETSVAWTDVLDLACEWASGENTKEGCISHLTSSLNSYSKIKYNVDNRDSIAPWGASSVLRLQYLLSCLAGPATQELDCYALSSFLNVLAYSIGIPYYKSAVFRLSKYPPNSGNIHTKDIRPANWSCDDDFYWPTHQIISFRDSYGDEYIADPSAKVYQSGSPVLAKGDVTYNTHIPLLTDDSISRGDRTQTVVF